jgi:hypothetical protein
VSDRYAEVAQLLRVDMAAAVRRAQRRHIMRLAVRYVAVVLLTAGLVAAGVLARKYIQSLTAPWRPLLILLLWLTIAVGVAFIASLTRSTVSHPGWKQGQARQNIWQAVARTGTEPAPRWVTVLAIAAVLVAAGALVYENWSTAAEWRASSDPLVTLSVGVLGAAALLAGILTRAAWRRWWPRRDEAGDDLADLPEDIPHARPVEVATERVRVGTRTFAVRLESHRDAGIQRMQEGSRVTATAAAVRPLTAAQLLFGGDQDMEPALARALDDSGVFGFLDSSLRQIPQAGRQAADRQVTSVAHGLIDLDLGDMVVAGWRKEGELAAAAERTAADPDSSEVVELANQRISSSYRPFVEMIINDVHMATINFELDIEFLIRTLVATMRGGHIINLQSASCEVTATLAAEGIRVASRRAIFDLRLIIGGPLLLKLRGDADPLPFEVRSSPTSPPPAAPAPSRPRRSPVNLSPRRQHHDQELK